MYPIDLGQKRKYQPADYEIKDLRTVSRRESISSRQLIRPRSSDSRYMTSPSVFSENKPCLKLEAANVDPNHQKIQDKMVAALKLLTFREQHVIIQFWSLCVVGKIRSLTAKDQPFGLGVTDHEGLRSYRQDSERYSFPLDEDHEEEHSSPAARVFTKGLPEWASDLSNCTLKHFPQKECADRCNLHGYLSLPVFYSTTKSCVGVLELLTSSKYMNYAYEVQNIHEALKMVNLLSPQGFDFPTSYVPNERRQNDWYEIFGILKKACDIHSLPCAQTWAVSPHASFVCHEKGIQKTCSGFDTRCIGKVCMFTASLPFYVKDLDVWSFREACRVRHLDRSRCLVGKALSSHGSCFCRDVTELSEDEYSLVHDARMNRLTGCFAIFLRSCNDDYVLEFFIPSDVKDSRLLPNLVQTLNQSIRIGSGFQLGNTSKIQVVGSELTRTVTVEITYNYIKEILQFPTSFGFSYLENEVSRRFKFKDKEFRLKYMDEENDPILITCDADLKLAVDTIGSNIRINLIRLPASDSVALESVTRMVTAEITFNYKMKIFQFSISLGFTYLKNEVSRRFKLEDKELRLKCIHEENDPMLITCDVDLKLAVDNTGSNNRIKLICLPGA